MSPCCAASTSEAAPRSRCRTCVVLLPNWASRRSAPCSTAAISSSAGVEKPGRRWSACSRPRRKSGSVCARISTSAPLTNGQPSPESLRPKPAGSQPSRRVFLKKAPTAAPRNVACRHHGAGDRQGRTYIVYPAGIGRSRLTNSLIDSKLGIRGTGRNWNTVLKLAELARA